MEQREWYLEYVIHDNRPGLLGDIATLLGDLSINIITINGIDSDRRGMLLHVKNEIKIKELNRILIEESNIVVSALRPVKLLDRVAIRHGRYLNDCVANDRTFCFTRNEIGLLVNFMAELLNKSGHQFVGVRGMPRVGKTESIIASCVCANKRWNLLSSTLLKQTLRQQLIKDEINKDQVYIIDGVVSTKADIEAHDQLVREVIRMNVTKIIEHPDVFIKKTEFTLDDFDTIIELRNYPEEEITYELVEK